VARSASSAGQDASFLDPTTMAAGRREKGYLYLPFPFFNAFLDPLVIFPVVRYPTPACRLA